MAKISHYIPTWALAGCLAAVGCDRVGDDGGSDIHGSRDNPVPGDTESPYRNIEQVVEPDVLKDADAQANLKAAKGTDAEGEVYFYDEPGRIRVVARINKARPGKHGLHIHEKGDCSDIEGKSMGGHFAPLGHEHGLPLQQEHHLGDLGNMLIDENGAGRLDEVLDKASLDPGHPRSLRGKAVVLHEGEDVGEAKQPAGGSGKPIACGVIGKD